MEGHSVVQWGKDDCAAAGLVKFDLFGLGMLEAIHYCVDLVYEQYGRRVNLWEIDVTEPEAYEMLARTDVVGVSQAEPRTQLTALPRLKPRESFDLVVEVALIRPGPIRGGGVYPYTRHRNGLEPMTYEYLVLEKFLGRTLDVLLFQEQLMQTAVGATGFSGAEAGSLCYAMGSRRPMAKTGALHARFLTGLEHTSGIDEDVGEQSWNKVIAFAAYGFPESHAQSFVSLAYFSAWFKYHYPAEFRVVLLRAQPMGFYSPQSLTADACRHGIGHDGPDIILSGVEASVIDGRTRLGFGAITGVGNNVAERIVAIRPFINATDVARRARLGVGHMEILARARAFRSLGINRRQALWAAGAAAMESESMPPGLALADAPALFGMTEFRLAAADLMATKATPRQYPVAALRENLRERGAVPAAELEAVPDGV